MHPYHPNYHPADVARVNVPLLRKAMEWAEVEATKPAEESQWNQLAYLSGTQRRCGTAYCVAGYVGQLLDARYADDEFGGDLHQHVSNFAAEALGLSREMEVDLFAATNDIEDLRILTKAMGL